MSAEEQGIENIWQIVTATLFFLTVASAILVVFDEEKLETTLFANELSQTILVTPENTSIVLKQIPENLIVSQRDNEITLSIEDNEEYSRTIQLKKNIEISKKDNKLTIIT